MLAGGSTCLDWETGFQFSGKILDCEMGSTESREGRLKIAQHEVLGRVL